MSNRIYVLHPETQQPITLRQLAQYTGLTLMGIRVRYSKYVNGYISYEELTRKKSTYNPLRIVGENKPITFVFRPEFVMDGEVITYAAYHPDNLTTPILGSIIRTANGWGWNCYPIGNYETKAELVHAFMKSEYFFLFHDVSG